MFFLGNMLHQLAQQATVTKFSSEAECTADECRWFHYLFTEICFQRKLFSVLLEDNHETIDSSKNSKFHGCTKHIEFHFHSCCEWVQNSDILVFLSLPGWIGEDIISKALPSAPFQHIILMMGIVSLVSSTIPIEEKFWRTSLHLYVQRNGFVFLQTVIVFNCGLFSLVCDFFFI